MARIGIYGGTFNPPHLGHMQAARQALECLQLDRLLLIPGGQPPHKELAQDSPTALQRTEMLQSMADALPRHTGADAGNPASGKKLHRRYLAGACRAISR